MRAIKQTTIRLRTDIYNKLQKQAKEQNRSLSNTINNLLCGVLNEREK